MLMVLLVGVAWRVRIDRNDTLVALELPADGDAAGGAL
jgi:hypothetical protein